MKVYLFRDRLTVTNCPSDILQILIDGFGDQHFEATAKGNVVVKGDAKLLYQVLYGISLHDRFSIE